MQIIPYRGDLTDLEFNILDEWFQKLSQDKRNDVDLHSWISIDHIFLFYSIIHFF